MGHSPSSASLGPADSPGAAIREGLRVVLEAPIPQKALVAVLALIALSFLPVGRKAPEGQGGPGGGLWKPFSVDAGTLFRERVAADFFSTYDAGARILRGEDPYVPPGAVSAPVRAPWATAYRYLPLPALVLGIPFQILPPWEAYGAWVGINALLLVLNFLFTVGRRQGSLVVLALVWFAWVPLAVEWYMGQYTFAMSTLLLWGLDSLVRRGKAGPWLWGGSVALKIYSVLMALPLWLWGRRRMVIVTLGAVVALTAGYFLFTPGSWASFQKLNTQGRLFLRERQPYAGAQGVQEALDATVWALQGRDFARSFGDQPPPSPAADPVAWATGLAILACVALLLWVAWKTRAAPDSVALGLFWLSWFYLYADCWEHHLVLIQGLVAWWVARGDLKPWQAVVAWVGAGTPSLWIPFSHAMAGSDIALSTLWGLAYFWQRPLAILFLTIVAVRNLTSRAPGVRTEEG